MAAVDVEIRQCRSGEDVALLEQALPSPGTSRFHEARFRRQVAGELRYLIAWLDGAPVGNLALILDGPAHPQARAGLPAGPELNGFDVHLELRNRGIGTRLVAAAEQLARELGHTSTVIGVEVGNRAAHRLYERLGYRDWPHGPMQDSYTWTDDGGVEHEQFETVVWMAKAL